MDAWETTGVSILTLARVCLEAVFDCVDVCLRIGRAPKVG